MKKLLLYASCIVFLFMLSESCKKASDDPPVTPVTKYLGWAVGTSDGQYGTILHTSDGKNWKRQGSSAQLTVSGFADITILDEKTLLVVGDATPGGTPNVYKSTDGGKNWKISGSKGLANVNYGGITTLGKDHIWIVGDTGSIYRSDDVGESWTKIAVPDDYKEDIFLRVLAKSTDDIWVVGDLDVTDSWPIMLHTTNGGTSWTRLNPLQDLGIEAQGGHYLGIKSYGKTIWVIGGPGKFVIYSDDNGDTWKDITPTPAYGDANDIIPLSEIEAYVVEDYGGIFSTNNAGQNWTEYYAGTNIWVTGLAIIDKINIWATGSPGGSGERSQILYSPDAGATWQDQSPDLLITDSTISMYKVRVVKIE